MYLWIKPLQAFALTADTDSIRLLKATSCSWEREPSRCDGMKTVWRCRWAADSKDWKWPLASKMASLGAFYMDWNAYFQLWHKFPKQSLVLDRGKIGNSLHHYVCWFEAGDYFDARQLTTPGPGFIRYPLVEYFSFQVDFTICTLSSAH